MKVIKKIVKFFGMTLLILAILALVADTIWIFGPQIMAGGKIADTDRYAQKISQIDVPDDVKLIGLGEATHGNVEFQEMKLSGLKTLVKKENVRAFALEIDFSEGMTLNNYIRTGDGNARDLVNSLSFDIYHTEQMISLVEWMRDYNAGKSPNQQLAFYGFDMQNPEQAIDLISNYIDAHQLQDVEKTKEAVALLDNKKTYQATNEENSHVSQVLTYLKEAIDREEQTEETQLMSRELTNVLTGIEYYRDNAADYDKMNLFRDKSMADTVVWIQNFEENRSGGKLMLAAHNGHVSKHEPTYTNMGQHLSENYGKKYFVIGTDFWDTTVNVNEVGRKEVARKNFSMNSADPLAAQAKRYGGSYYLDFSKIEENSSLADLVNKPINLGSLGEGYHFLYQFLPTVHRQKGIPSEKYDAMMFVYKATPISVFKENK